MNVKINVYFIFCLFVCLFVCFNIVRGAVFVGLFIRRDCLSRLTYRNNLKYWDR